MRRLATTTLIALALPAGVAAATAPPDGTGAPAAPTESSMPADTSMSGDTAAQDSASPPDAEPATVFDDDGNPVATITAGDVETAWSDFAEDDAPDEGNEYVRLAVTVESQMPDEETFGIGVGDFVLQSNNGTVTTAENIRTAAEVEADEDVADGADIANGESVDLTLTFQVDANAGPQSVFYRPDDDTLVDIAEITQ